MKDALEDVLCGSGAIAVSYGAYLVYEPAGFIVGGLLLITGGFFVAKAKGHR